MCALKILLTVCSHFPREMSFPCLLQAMDRMEAEWESIILEIVPYKETGTFIMKSGDETAQLLDDHIVMAQAMSFSPYKKPFELRITTWESKLRLIQVKAEIQVYFALGLHVCSGLETVCNCQIPLNPFLYFSSISSITHRM